MSFIWPLMLLSLLVIPLLVWGYCYFWLLRRRQQATVDLGPLGIIRSSSGAEIGARRHVSPAFYVVGLSLLLFALARPEMTVSLPRVEGTVILAFDVSGSMNADDLEPTRIKAAKRAARAFVENQPATVQIGVVAFSGGGVVVQPPTNEQSAVLDTIDRLSPQGGTSLGQGIFSSLNAIAGETIAIDVDPETETFNVEEIGEIGYFPSAVVVLLSDGEHTGGSDPLEIAQLAAEAGVRVFPVGIGSTEGAVVEVEGFNILSQLNETALQDIASLTNGAYYSAADEESLREIYETIDLRLTVRGEKMEITAIVAGISALLFLVGGSLSLVWFGRVP
jgi:Ca-activated chloride channel family protein